MKKKAKRKKEKNRQQTNKRCEAREFFSEKNKRMQIIVAASGPKYISVQMIVGCNTFLFNFNLRSRGMKGIEHSTHKRRRRRRVEKYPSEENGICVCVCRHVVGNVPGVTRGGKRSF
jgi:hypothetical protein